MYMAECRAINKTAMSDDSMPTARAKPLSWQKAELDGMGPQPKLTMGKTTNMMDLRKSLWMSSKINLAGVSEWPATWAGGTCSCRKLRLIFTNQYKAESVDTTLIEAMVTEMTNKARTKCWFPSTPEMPRPIASSVASDVAVPLKRSSQISSEKSIGARPFPSTAGASSFYWQDCISLACRLDFQWCF
jgi:hypothetical protein